MTVAMAMSVAVIAAVAALISVATVVSVSSGVIAPTIAMVTVPALIALVASTLISTAMGLLWFADCMGQQRLVMGRGMPGPCVFDGPKCR